MEPVHLYNLMQVNCHYDMNLFEIKTTPVVYVLIDASNYHLE